MRHAFAYRDPRLEAAILADTPDMKLGDTRLHIMIPD